MSALPSSNAADELVVELDAAARFAAMRARYDAAARIVKYVDEDERWQLLWLVVFGSTAIDAAIAKSRSCPPDTDEALTASAAVDERGGDVAGAAAARRPPARLRDWSWWDCG